MTTRNNGAEAPPLTRLSDDAIDPLCRLSVEVEHPDEPPGLQGLITIREEEMTSRAPTAQVTRVRNAIDLTPDEARWLHAALGRVLAGSR